MAGTSMVSSERATGRGLIIAVVPRMNRML